MVSAIPKSVQRIWNEWNLRGSIILSLSLQTFLILFAPFRKRTENMWVILLIWSAYLLADWVANFAVGLISNSQGGSRNPDGNRDALLGFWAPFLLLHLGGPDTITAFALEDNALWLRHLLGLVFQVIAALYVFIQTLPKNKLWLPTLLLFLAGVIKYAERTRALFLASLDRFKESMLEAPDPGPNYAKLMAEYSSKKDSKLPTRIEMTPEPDRKVNVNVRLPDEGPLDNVLVVQHAYHFFKLFKGLIVDLIFSFRERDESRSFFYRRTSEEALSLISVELNFIYEVLYTKVVVVHSTVGYVFRFISFSAVLVALLLFNSFEKRIKLHHIDVGITYMLLLGAIGLDTIAFFKLIFSDWTVISLKKKKKKSWIVSIFEGYLKLKRPSQFTNSPNCLEWARRILFRRWSESVSSFNLINYCLKERPKGNKVIDYGGPIWLKVIDTFGLKDFLDKMKYVSSKPLDKKLWEFIFEELKKKSNVADDPETAKRVCSARGDWVLQDSSWNNDSTTLMPYVSDVDYDQSLLLWHIATEICYNNDNANRSEDANIEFSKTLSDYMLYLLVMQPTMMSSIAGIGQIRFRDTCAEAKKFFSRSELKPEDEQNEACKRILEVNTDVKPVAVKGDRSKSVLFDASILAKELANKEKKWELMSAVWVELLAYAASHCRANTHAQLLSKGGELVTFVWLSMAHFGIADQYQISKGHARAELIVGK